MRGTQLTLAWLLVFLAAAYDCTFAWQYREVLPSWELNPLARWAAAHVGLPGIFAFKFAGLELAGGLAWYGWRRQPILSHGLTAFVAGVYGLLLVHYAVGYQQPTSYELASRSAAVSR